jgi:hypothetical protein
VIEGPTLKGYGDYGISAVGFCVTATIINNHHHLVMVMCCDDDGDMLVKTYVG